MAKKKIIKKAATIEDLSVQIEQQGIDFAENFKFLMGHTDERFNCLEGRMDGLEGKVDRLGGKVDCLEGRMDGLEGKVDRLEGKVDGLEGKVDRLGGKVDGLGGRMEKLEKDKVWIKDILEKHTTILQRLDEERIFTLNYVNRLENEINKIKTHLHIA